MRLVPFILMFSVLSSCKAQPARPLQLPISKTDNSLLWEISGNGLLKPSFIFGTFHLMCKADIHFSEQLRTAVKASDKVYLEMDLDDPSVALSAIFFINMKNGKTLKDLYSPADYSKVDSFFTNDLGLSLRMFQKMKPVFLESMMYTKLLQCPSPSGVEEELMKVASENKKEILGLETMEFQASVFDNIPYEQQAKSLLNTIDSIEQTRKYFARMISIYKSQELSKVDSLMDESGSGLEVENRDILLTKRNENWVNQLKNILKSKTIFMAVGAAHLTGKDGLIELMKKQGYTVRPVVNQ